MEESDVSLSSAFSSAANDNVGLLELSENGLHHALNPPHDNTQGAMHKVTVNDPFRPLENLEAPETAAWVQRENKQFLDYISDASKSEKAAVAFLTDAMNYDTYTIPARYGDKYFRVYKEGLAAQAHLEVSDSADGPWKILVDPNTMSADGTVSLSSYTPSGDGKRLVYFISESGSDTKTLYVLDVETGEYLSGVAKCNLTSVLWDRDSHDGFQYTYPDGFVRHHVAGRSAREDDVVFTPLQRNHARPFRFDAGKYDWMYQSPGTEKNFGLLFRPMGSNDPFTEIVKPAEFSLRPVAELEDGSVLAVANKDAVRGRLVLFNPNDPAPEKWETILPEHDVDVLDNVLLHKGKLFAFYTHDAADAIRIFDPKGAHLYDMPLPVQSTAVLAHFNADDDKILMRISSFKSRGDFYSYDVGNNELTFDKKGPGKYDLNDCIVERLYATSKDGTTVPMTVIRSPDTKLDGTAAVRMTGYGGFNVSLFPFYDPSIVHFVRSGGIYVQTNLRGGGEFGQDWYNQGRLENKQNVFDDFAACAEFLIKSNYTTPKRLVIAGGSNGGLLTSAAALQHPELFGAVVTQVPVADMLRLSGNWASDYGDPRKTRKDFNAAARYSPVHNVKSGAEYPPQLIMTADHDDRVKPWHSFKLAATLQAQSSQDNVTLLAVETNAGHGEGRPTDKIIKEQAEIFAFIEKAIGPVNQRVYKAKLAREKRKAAIKPAVRRHGAGHAGLQ